MPYDIADAAHRLYKLALQHGFTRGRRVNQVRGGGGARQYRMYQPALQTWPRAQAGCAYFIITGLLGLMRPSHVHSHDTLPMRPHAPPSRWRPRVCTSCVDRRRSRTCSSTSATTSQSTSTRWGRCTSRCERVWGGGDGRFVHPWEAVLSSDHLKVNYTLGEVSTVNGWIHGCTLKICNISPLSSPLLSSPLLSSPLLSSPSSLLLPSLATPLPTPRAAAAPVPP